MALVIVFILLENQYERIESLDGRQRKIQTTTGNLIENVGRAGIALSDCDVADRERRQQDVGLRLHDHDRRALRDPLLGGDMREVLGLVVVRDVAGLVLEAESEGDARRAIKAVPSQKSAVPASLHASLMARLDRLRDERRDASLRFLDALDTKTPEGSQVSVIPAVAGGS